MNDSGREKESLTRKYAINPEVIRDILDMDIDFGVIPTVVATLMKHVEPKALVQLMIEMKGIQ